MSRTSLWLFHLAAVVLGLAAESHMASKEKGCILKSKTDKKKKIYQIYEMQREKNVRNLVGSYSRRNKLM